MHFVQSYGPEHLLTFSNLRRAGLLTEQAPGDTLTAVESKVSKLVTDKAAGEQGAQVAPSALPGPRCLFSQQVEHAGQREDELGEEKAIPYCRCPYRHSSSSLVRTASS